MAKRVAPGWLVPEGVKPPTVVAHSTLPVDFINEWVVEVDGVRRARYIGHHTVYYAAREANRWRFNKEAV